MSPQLDAYMGLELERIATQAYDGRALALQLPLLARWGRWEGNDRRCGSLELDIVAELTDGRCLTGSVKWSREPIGAGVHHAHLEMLRRAADAGRAWAHAALQPEAPLYYVAAGGFTDAFKRAVEESGKAAILWSLGELKSSRRHRRRVVAGREGAAYSGQSGH